ncbi:MAG: 30S ribosomal protein S11 [Candidatus Omnitrophica bacterium]|nr:30S ribosomal protein S11 [Candidatus Omnitrophota bacterium]
MNKVTQSTKPVRRKKIVKKVSEGIFHVHATFNNSIVTVTDKQGKVLCWASSGTVGFKGSRKSTPFAASKAAAEASKKAKSFGITSAEVRMKGPGAGKESALRAIRAEGFQVSSIVDLTPTPHNGCRPRKRRRV